MGFLVKLIKYISHIFIWGTWERHTPCLSHPPELEKGNLATSCSEKGKKEDAKVQVKIKKETLHLQPHAFSLSSTRVAYFGKFELEWQWKKRRLVGDLLSQRVEA